MTKSAYIVDALRTPIGKYGGSLSSVRADDLVAHVISKLVERNFQVDPSALEDVIIGCVNQAGEDNRNVARMAVLLAGLPNTVAGLTVNRLCASGMEAVVQATRAITLGEGEVFIAGGVENMSRAPYVMKKPDKSFSRFPEVYDTSIGWRFVNSKMKHLFGVDSMGETAENVAQKFGITREAQDLFALSSQEKANKALVSGRLAKEIVSISVAQKKANPIEFSCDEFLRPDTTLQVLQALKPAFRKDGSGSVTAGNCSGINDGACALLLASESAISRYKLSPCAQIVASAVVGVEPRIMGIGPVDATKKVLKRAGLNLDDINVIELNEAFAAQSLACLSELGLSEKDQRVNPNGGAIALGHPLGMTGARLIQTAMQELEERQEQYALCTMCVGVGQGMAAVIKRV